MDALGPSFIGGLSEALAWPACRREGRLHAGYKIRV